MLEVFNLTINKVGIMLMVIAAGFAFRCSKKMPEQNAHALSLLCLLIFTPAYNIVKEAAK